MNKNNSRKKSIFYDNWQDCLQEHYLYVISSQDAVTEPTLRGVLQETGFSDDDIENLHTIAHQTQESEPEENQLF